MICAAIRIFFSRLFSQDSLLETSGCDQLVINVKNARNEERERRLKRCFRILLAISLA